MRAKQLKIDRAAAARQRQRGPPTAEDHRAADHAFHRRQGSAPGLQLRFQSRSPRRRPPASWKGSWPARTSPSRRLRNFSSEPKRRRRGRSAVLGRGPDGHASSRPRPRPPAAKSEPRKLRLKPLWKCDAIHPAGNILVAQEAGGKPRIYVIDGFQAMSEIGLGRQARRQPQGEARR